MSLLVMEIETKLKRIMTWLTDSGMKVNESKIELCLFHKGDTTKGRCNYQSQRNRDHVVR